ncbi:peptidase M20, partial [Klebsiella pneumoniae]
FSPVLLGAGVIAAALSLWPVKAPTSTWGGWVGLIALVFLFGCIVQGAAPEAALLFVWPALLAAIAAALAALISPDLTRPAGLIPPAVAGVLGSA